MVCTFRFSAIYIGFVLLALMVCGPKGYGQQEVNCDPIAVLIKPGEDEITLSALLKLKGPKLVYLGCDTNRTDLVLHSFSLYLLHGTDIQHMSWKSGKGAQFDKADIVAIGQMADGDFILVNDIAFWSATFELNFSPIRMKIINDLPKKAAAETEENEPKLLVRSIVLCDTVVDTATKKKVARPDTTLANKLIDAVKAGKARANPIAMYNAQNPLSVAEVKKILADKIDSLLVEDIDGSALVKVVRTPFNFGNVRSFRVLEQVTVDEETGKDEMEILAIAPVCDYTDEDGKMLGCRPLFWIKYEDIEEDINEFEAKHKQLKLIAAIKADYKKAKPRAVKKKVEKQEEKQEEKPEDDQEKLKSKTRVKPQDKEDSDEEEE